MIDGLTFCASSEDSDKVHVFPAILNHSSSVEQYPRTSASIYTQIVPSED